MVVSTRDDIISIFLAVLFVLVCVLGSCKWYANRQGISLKAALLLLWQKGVIAGFQAVLQSLVPTVKAAWTVLWSYVKRWAAALVAALAAYLKPAPVKYIYTPDLHHALLEVVKDYVYAPFQPVINVSFGTPSCIYVSLCAKSAITEQTMTEIMWHLQAKYQEYLACYGLDFEYTAFPYVQGNRLDVYLYYCESSSEYPAYRECCRRMMQMYMPPDYRPMTEADVMHTPGLVLGYRYETWKATGQVDPIIWDTATAPHLLVAGPTGGGKTVFVKLLLERLMREGAAVTVCDFKGFGDYGDFVAAYATGIECDTMLSAFCADFEHTREVGKAITKKKVLIFDEFSAFSASKSSKERELLMRQVFSLVAMGRAYGYHVILVGQRFDADVLKTALREQFGVRVHMGASISQEAARMLFPGAELNKGGRLAPCCGYISTPTVGIDTLILPTVDIAALNRRLKALGKKNKTPGAA